MTKPYKHEGGDFDFIGRTIIHPSLENTIRVYDVPTFGDY